MERLFKVLIALLLLLVDLPVSIGQEAVPASGGNATGGGGTSAFTVGQVAYANFQSDAGNVSLGVQQVFFKITVATEDPQPDISIDLFPNPVQTDLQLSLSQKWPAVPAPDFTYRLYDLYGKEFLNGQANTGVTNISMEHVAEGVYFLEVRRHAASIKTFKVIKTN